MTSEKPMIVSVRDENGREWSVDVFSEEARAEVKVFFKRLWDRYPAEQAAHVGQIRRMSDSEVKELQRQIEASVRLGYEPFDPRHSEQGKEDAATRRAPTLEATS